jgi:hypothetical protein
MLRGSRACFPPHVRNLEFPGDPCRGWREIRYTLNLATELRSVLASSDLAAYCVAAMLDHQSSRLKYILGSRIAFDNAQETTKTLRRHRGTIAKSSGIKGLSATPRPVPKEKYQCAQQAETCLEICRSSMRSE